MDPGNERPGELRRRLATRLASPTRYEVLAEVARGGMGRIYRVRDLELGRVLAMKVLEPGEHGDRLLARFLEEARLTSQLDHPGIVPVHDVGVLPDGRIFYTMPLVEGRTLDEVLKLARAGREGWSRARVLHVLLRACEALAYAHERGVVHRDLKPANLMVGRHGEVLVMDWGLARHERHARGGTLGGTPATIPPDLLAGKGEVDALADVYAFGAILYALCAGGLPYEDAGQKVDLARILREPPTPLAELDPTLPPDLIAITEKAMARDPRARYASMAELREDLQRFLEGRIVAAHPVGRVEAVRKWILRNKELAFGLAASFTLLLALVLVQHEKVKSVERAHAETLKSAYVANLSAADASLRMSETGEAKRRLEACDPALRGWEWRHLRLQADSSESVLLSAPHDVDALAATPDGERVATGTEDGVILWDAISGARIAERRFGAGVLSLAFSPAGDELAAGLADGALLRLAAGDLTERSSVQAHRFGVSSVAYSPGGGALASLSQNANEVRLEREGAAPLVAEVRLPSSLAFAGEEILAVGSSEADVRLYGARDLVKQHDEIKTGRVESLACHPDGHRLAAGCMDGRVLLLDCADAGILWSTQPHDEKVHSALVGAVAWDPSGRVLATGADDRSIVLLSDDGVLLSKRFGHEKPVEALAFVQSGARLVSGSSDGTARLWRTAGGAQTILPAGERWVAGDRIEGVAFLPRSARLASLHWGPALHLWNVGTGSLLDALPLDEKPSRLAAAPEGAHVACAVGSRVVVLDLDARAPVESFDLAPAHAQELAYGPSGRVVARTSDGRLVELAPGTAPRTVAGELDDGLSSALDVDRDRNLAAVGLLDGRVRVIDLASGETLHDWPVAASQVTALAFDADGERLLAGAADGVVVLIDARDGDLLATLRGHDGRVTAVAFGPEDRITTASRDATLRVWRGSDLLLTLRGHGDGVLDLAVQGSGERIASTSQDGSVRLWSAPAAGEAR